VIAHDPREIVAVQFFVELGVENLHQPQPFQTLANVGSNYKFVQQVAISVCRRLFPLIREQRAVKSPASTYFW